MRKELFAPYQLNTHVTLRNRFVMAPMTTWSGNLDGSISEAELTYYLERSHGVGMVITATTFMETYGKGFDRQFYGGTDAMIPSLKSLSEAIKSGGAKAILQVFHAGRKGNPSDMPDGLTRSASDVPAKREANNTPKAMTQAEIENTISEFKNIVKRAFKAGFDGIEIHGANTYLIQQFFSPHSNRRQDKWGGSLENRLKFPMAVVNACIEAREEIDSDDFIIGYRFSPEENSEPGISIDETEKLVDALCKTKLDYLHISLGQFDQTSIRNQSEDVPVLMKIASVIHGRKPFIGVGSVYSLENAFETLELGADLVALGRQLIIDSKTIEKWGQGQMAERYYTDNHHETQSIPKGLHEKILSIPEWLPKKGDD